MMTSNTPPVVPAPPKKGKGKKPVAGASKPAWAKIADAMKKC